jgi:hypothetical protein
MKSEMFHERGGGKAGSVRCVRVMVVVVIIIIAS